MGTRIVIVGGGFGGLCLAQRLRHTVRSLGAEIVLIDREPYHTLRPKLPQAVGGRIACSVHIPFEEIVTSGEIQLVQAAITRVDPMAHRVFWQDGQMKADILVLAVGGQSRIPLGLLETSVDPLPIWSFDEACGIRRRVQFVANAAKRGKAMNPDVVVIGAGFVGTELAAEIQHRLGRLVGEGAHVTLIEAQSRILPRLSPRAAELARRRLLALGVSVLTDTHVTQVEPQGVILDDGSAVTAGTIVWAGGVQTPDLLASARLVDESGRVPVDVHLRSTRFDGVYAIGDCAYIAKDGLRVSEPSAHTAAREAKTVARNILRQLEGKGPIAHKPDREKYVLGLGPGYALLEAPPLPHVCGRLPELMKEAIMARHLWALGGYALLRRCARSVLGAAKRRESWDREPLPDGNVLNSGQNTQL